MEFGTSEFTEREEKTEDDKIIEINADGDDIDHDNIGGDAAQDHKKGLEKNEGVNNPSSETNDLIIVEGPAPNEGDDQDNDPQRGRSKVPKTNQVALQITSKVTEEI